MNKMASMEVNLSNFSVKILKEVVSMLISKKMMELYVVVSHVDGSTTTEKYRTKISKNNDHNIVIKDIDSKSRLLIEVFSHSKLFSSNKDKLVGRVHVCVSQFLPLGAIVKGDNGVPTSYQILSSDGRERESVLNFNYKVIGESRRVATSYEQDIKCKGDNIIADYNYKVIDEPRRVAGAMLWRNWSYEKDVKCKSDVGNGVNLYKMLGSFRTPVASSMCSY